MLVTAFYKIEVTNKNEVKKLSNLEIYFRLPNLSSPYCLFQ